MDTHRIDSALTAELLKYLATRPWREVNPLIVALVRARERDDPAPYAMDPSAGESSAPEPAVSAESIQPPPHAAAD